MGLTEYKRKRNFATTAEPKGGKRLPKAVKGASRFVIQKHDASRLHYDFRLEMDGVLKSWAVPKGLPWKKGEKHLAVEVEDHPVEYATFEGIIPKGQYGGGTVMIWDRGKYYVHGEKPLMAWRDGRLHLVLDGQKAKGEWALIRIRSNEDKNPWLLIKAGSSIKPLSRKADDESAKTGRTLKQIAAAHDAEWESKATDKASASSGLKARIRKALKKKGSGEDVGRALRTRPRRSGTQFGGRLGKPSLPDSLPTGKPRFIEPMKPRLVDSPPPAGDWMYELKFDGIRALAVKKGNRVSFLSRNQNELGKRFPEIVAGLTDLSVDECVLDGEVVALDHKGRSSFQLLQALEMEGRSAPVYYYVFDVLQAQGKSTLSLPLHQRKELVARVLAEAADPLRISNEIGADPQALLQEVKRLGLEGIVGKLRDSLYEPGRRSGAWIKLKCVMAQEFVIGGYTAPAGARKYFGAILVGYYDRSSGKKGGHPLRFAGKVGTGFDGKMLAVLYKRLQAERRADSPFIDLTGKTGGQLAPGLSPAELRKCTWVKPTTVCQVKFAEWTRDGKLRQPVFLGLREDKKPQDVVKEQ
jgi:bifunctional non-homologous end joining protein LigD